MSICCWLGIHAWSKWEKLYTFTGEYTYTGGQAVGFVQERNCKCCGKIEQERVNTI